MIGLTGWAESSGTDKLWHSAKLSVAKNLQIFSQIRECMTASYHLFIPTEHFVLLSTATKST